jgi:hypothetical protein
MDNDLSEDEQEQDHLSPLLILAISVAYEIGVDSHISSQEKGKLVTLFGKLVEMGSIKEEVFQSLVRKAFKYTEDNSVEDFLINATPVLTDTQKLAIIINLYDTMQVDGHIKIGEEGIIKKFEEAFAIDKGVARGVREFLNIKNDTSIFLDMSHPLNNMDLDLGQMFDNN